MKWPGLGRRRHGPENIGKSRSARPLWRTGVANRANQMLSWNREDCRPAVRARDRNGPDTRTRCDQQPGCGGRCWDDGRIARRNRHRRHGCCGSRADATALRRACRRMLITPDQQDRRPGGKNGARQLVSSQCDSVYALQPIVVTEGMAGRSVLAAPPSSSTLAESRQRSSGG